MKIAYCQVPTISNVLYFFAVVLCLSSFLRQPLCAQSTEQFRDQAFSMLKIIKADLKDHYYDVNYRGVDLEARFKLAEDKIKVASNLNQMYGIIAQAVTDLNDSHTFFYPPLRSTQAEYGWQMQMVGTGCYVIAVKPGSDADAKGLKPGDAILSVNGFKPGRENLWKLRYLFYTLMPVAKMQVEVQSPGGTPRRLEFASQLKQEKLFIDLASATSEDFYRLRHEAEAERRLHRHRYAEIGQDILVWKMPEFDLQDSQVDDLMSKAKKRKALILDMRGNGGGAVSVLQRLLGHFFDKDIKIADLQARKEMKPMMARNIGRPYEGKVIVLIDSESGSAAEVFARVMQIEKRGIVIGDRSAGAVMQTKYHPHKLGAEMVIHWGATITNADLLMTDGRSLEKVGVTPDELLLPTNTELRDGDDTVLARATALAGFPLEPKHAGKMFPLEWRK
jgi:C-terminal processing protease CtpA/Prc